MVFSLLIDILYVYIIVALGYLMHRQGWLPDGIDTGVMRLAVNLLVPCLILDKLIGDPALDHPVTVVSAMALGFGLIVVGLFLCMMLAPVLGLKEGGGKRTFAITTAFQNYGFIALPVVISLFGEGPLALLFLFGMGVEVSTWTIAVMILKGAKGIPWRLMINGPFVAVTGGLLLHYLGAHHWMPAPIDKTLVTLGSCAVPMCLFMVGVTISHQSKSAEWSLRWPTVAGAVLLRLAVLPALILACAHFLPLREELKQVMLVQAAMPSAVFPIILARLYGGHPPTAIQIVLATTFVSLFTMPVVLKFGALWLGLTFLGAGQ